MDGHSIYNGPKGRKSFSTHEKVRVVSLLQAWRESVRNTDGTAFFSALADDMNRKLPIYGLTSLPSPVTAAQLQEWADGYSTGVPTPEEMEVLEFLAENAAHGHRLLDLWEMQGIFHYENVQHSSGKEDRDLIIDRPDLLRRAIATFQQRFGLVEGVLDPAKYDWNRHMNVQSGVAREYINKLKNSEGKESFLKKSHYITVTCLADYMDMKLRYEEQLGKEYVPGKALIERWENGGQLENTEKFALCISKELIQRKLHQGSMTEFSREALNRRINGKTGDSRIKPMAYRFARMLERFDLDGKAPLRWMSKERAADAAVNMKANHYYSGPTGWRDRVQAAQEASEERSP